MSNTMRDAFIKKYGFLPREPNDLMQYEKRERQERISHGGAGLSPQLIKKGV